MSKQVLVSGIQPTGKMHLGNYLGSVSNWLNYQDEYDCYFMIVDLHALTTVYENPGKLADDKFNLALDILASGVDPEKAAIFYQSDVLEHSELHLILSMITPVPWLTRVPTYKDKQQELKEKDLNTYGFLGYPVLQAADILLYKGEVVPVGKDQLPHLELTREIARRFNHFFKPLFKEPDEKLTNYPTLLGTDGRKMSKSYGNTIPVSDSREDIQKKIMRMFTDPNRVKRTDLGHPDQCPVFGYQKIFNSSDRISEIDRDCRAAQIGCVDCKRECSEKVIDHLSLFHKRRKEFASNREYVNKCLEKGADKARKTAQETLKEVRNLVGLC